MNRPGPTVPRATYRSRSPKSVQIPPACRVPGRARPKRLCEGDFAALCQQHERGVAYAPKDGRISLYHAAGKRRKMPGVPRRNPDQSVASFRRTALPDARMTLCAYSCGRQALFTDTSALTSHSKLDTSNSSR